MYRLLTCSSAAKNRAARYRGNAGGALKLFRERRTLGRSRLAEFHKLFQEMAVLISFEIIYLHQSLINIFL